ncbi:multiple epidermal growth factor-like domains protein 11 [Littorina saxatilis]|uniref:multiple epidermal growth factor-like domains protein 11 n=1 Tax=Littorina saxatilis TaxID=31220 RepID=UPI0038B4D8F3
MAMALAFFLLVSPVAFADIQQTKYLAVNLNPGTVLNAVEDAGSLRQCALRCPQQSCDSAASPCCTLFCWSKTSLACYVQTTSRPYKQLLPSAVGFRCFVKDNFFLYPFTITVDDQICVTVTSDPGTRRHSVTCIKEMYGQVVRLTRKTLGVLVLCEFQILVPSGLSQCPAGQYGAQCQFLCGNCGGGQSSKLCYQDTGFCYDECVDKYSTFNGNTCQPCSSDCRDGECDRVTGICIGCENGFYGDQCTSRCSSSNSRCAQCAQDVNVAINKIYSQISFNDTSVPASYAANGNTTGAREGADNCIVTRMGEYGPNPNDTSHWWEVDLGRTYPVKNITVWALENGTDYLCPFTITVDNQTCVNETSYQGSPNTSVTCDSVTYGQVVRLSRTQNDNILAFCEFQILVPVGVSQCPAGQYGAQCELNCSDNCGGGQGSNFCDQDTGACYDDCDGGQYGPSRCSLFCGQCQTGEQCHPVTGHCPHCQLGVYPPLCTEDPSGVQNTVTLTLTYVVTVCTRATENEVETTIRARIVKQNEDWPGLCIDKVCTNADVTVTCGGISPKSVKIVIEVNQVP